MRQDFQRTKFILTTLAGLLILADAAMGVYSFNESSPILSPQQQLAMQTAQIKLLRADVDRARAIQRDLPKIKADCERFENGLPPARSGYSVISLELVELARKSGLQLSALDFHPVVLADRGLTEVSVGAKISGDYIGVVRLVNGLQRSKNYYIVDSLSLSPIAVTATGASGTVTVDLHLRSYFRGTP